MLKLNIKTSCIVFSLLLSLAVSAFFGIHKSEAANQVNVTAYVVDKSGQPLADGEYSIRFAIYSRDRLEMDPYPSNVDAGYRIWQETQKISVFGGIMSAYLGAVIPLPGGIDFNQNDYYLGTQIGTDSEMAPRKKLGSALSAINSSFLQGRTVGNQAGNIPALGTNGGLDPVILDKINRVGTIGQGIWEGEVIANDYLETDFTGKTYEGLTIKTSGGNNTLTVSSDVTLNQNLSTSSTPTFAAINLTDGLPIDSGGTNATSIGVAGSVAYSDGTAYAFTGAGTAGQYLVSNGSGAPTWQTIAGAGVGGSGLAGHMPYWSDANNLAYDTDGNFYWDATNNRLGIGTATPAQALDVAGAIRSSSQFISTVASGTAPMQVSSNTLVANLNADYLDGQHASAFLTENQTITLSGDVTGSGTTGITVTIANNSVDGTNIALGSDAQGDIMYYNGTDWARLAAGTSGQFLASNGAGSNPSWGVPSGAGDITAIGNVSSGEAFTGTQGTELYFNDSDGDGLLTIANLSAARIYTLPNATGTVITSGNLTDITATGIIASGTWNGGVIDEAYGGTGMAAYAEGDMLYYDGGTLTRLAAGTNGQILGAVGGPGNVNPTWMNAPFVGSHNLLSLSHPDTTAASPLAGDLITGIDTGGGTIRWQRYAIGSANDILMTNGTGNGVDWNPQTSITQLGTITAGIWNGTAIGVTRGGTGLATINQGGILYANANNSLAALEGASGDDTEYLRFHWNGGSPYLAWETASGSFTSFTLSGDSGANQTIDDADILEIAGGTNITSVASATDTITLNLDSTLTGTIWNGNTIGVGYGGTGITSTPTNGQLLIGNGTNYTLANLTSTGASIAIANTAGGINLESSLGTSVSLTSEVTGTLPVGSGGTGAATLTDGGILLGSGTSAITPMGVLGNGSIVIGDGVTDPTTLAAFSSSTGTLYHEYGGLEANVSAYSGLLKISGGVTSYIPDNSVNWDTAYSHSLDNTQAHSDYLINNGDDSTSGRLTAAGFTTNIQNGLQFDPFNTGAGNTSEIRFMELAANGTNYVGFKAPDNIADGSGSVIWTLPALAGSANNVLTTDSSGNLSWTSVAGVGGMNSFTLSGDSGANQTIDDADILEIAGGTNITSVASATDTITLNLDSTLTGTIWNGNTIGVGYGGTGITGTPTNGQLLIGNGTNYTLAILTDGAGINISEGSGAITIAAALGNSVDLTSEVTGILPLANGGTNTNATPTAGAISYGTGSAYAFNTAGTAGQVLLSGGAGAPTWSTGAVTLAGNFITSGASSLTLATTGATNVTLPTGGTLATLALAETFTNKTIGSGSTWNGNTIGTSYITNDSLLEVDFDVTNDPTDNYILSYDQSSGGFTWIENTGGSGESKWSQASGFTYLTQTGDDLVLGSDGTTDAKFLFDVSDSSITFEGATNDAYTTEFVITDPTENRTITFPNASGTVVFSGGTGSSLWTNDGTITYLTETGDDMVVGGSDLSSPLSVDVSANTVRIGDATAAGSAILNMYASDGDTGSITYNTNDAWAFEGGNVGIGDTSPLSLFTVGSGDLFQINSSGQIAAAAGITSSGTITFSGLTTDGVATVASGVLGSEARLAIARGGTNTNATPTAGAISYGTGSAYAFSAAGTAGQVLLSGGAGAPTWSTGAITLAGNFITSGANSLTLTTTGETSVTLPVGGTLATLAGSETFTNKTIGSGSTWNGNTIGVGYGGTGITGTPTNGQLLIGNGTNYTLAILTDGAGINISEGSGAITIAAALGNSVDLTSEVTGILPVANGGTGITTAGLTGVPVISSGTWSVDTNALAVAHGGTGEVSEANLEDKIEGYIFDADAATILGAWTVSDNVALSFGTNNDLQIAYDETTDDRMEITDGSNLLGAFSDAGTVGNLYLTGGISTFDSTVTAGYGEFTGLCLGNGINCITTWTSVSGVTGTGTAGNAVFWTSANTLGSEPYLGTSRGGTGIDTATATGVPIITAGTWSVSSILGAALGGTGIDGSSAGNGTLLIGNGSGYSLTTLTDGTGITITEASGSITIDSTLGTSVDGTEIAIASQAQGDVLYYNGTAWTRLAAGSAGQYLQGGTAPSWDTPTGAGDVTNVGDCAGGACFDGTIDGGTYISFYDPQGTGQLITGNLTQARVWTLPDATGTVALTSDLHSASTITDTTSIDMSITGQQISGVVLPAGVDHNSLANLTTGDYHTQYALLTGRSGGQTLIGGTASGDDLTLQTTSDVTKGSYILSDLASGLVLSTSGTLSVITNNSTNWDAGYTNRLTGVTDNVTGLDFSLGSNNATLALTSGYVIPTTTQESNWGSAYSHSTATTNVHGLTFTAEGSGGGLDADTLDGHDTAYFQVAGSYQPLHANLTSLSALSYSANSFVKMTAAGTFALDTNTYLTSYTETDPRLPAVGTSGNLLQSDGSAWTSWTPNYLTSYTETDPIWTAAAGNYFNLSENETVTGIPAFNGGTTGSSAPFTVDSTYLVTNLNADLLDGQEGSYYQTAYTNLTSIGSLANGTGWLYNNGSGTFSYSTPTGLISGLTANYIPYATSATALGDSGMYWDSGNSRLGIGTTTPGDSLEIFGAGKGLRLSYDASNYVTLASDSSGQLSVNSSSATYSAVVVGDGSEQDIMILMDGNAQDYYAGLDDTDDAFKIGLGSAVGTNSYLTILSGGNVGIGATTPSQALELGASKWLAFEGATDDTNETVLQVTDPTADNIITFPNVTGTVWTSGNDGTGSTLDADTIDGHDTAYFQVAGSYQPLHANLTSLSALSYSANSFVKMTAAGTFALDTNTYLTSFTETDPIWTAAAGNYFNLSENETVTGIPAFNGGTTGSSAPFTVDSTYLVTNLNADLLDGQEGSYYQTAYTNLTSIGSLANGTGWLYNNGSGTFSYSTPTGLISGLTANYIPYATSATALGNSGMYWDSGNSRLGIGTTTPSSKLDIYGTSNSLRLSYDASNYGLLSTASNGDLTITSSNMTETAIVIGNNAALDASIQFDENTQDYYFGVDNTDHFLKMGLGTAVGITPYFAMDTSGNVGIGATTPSQALELGTSKWLAFEGATDNTYETTIQVTDPTADNVITFPNVTGTVWTSGNDGTGSTLDADTLDGHDTAYFQTANTNLTSIGSLANGTGWLYNNGSGAFSYSTPTGLLSGLTANYIPYATSATALGDSGMYWDSGNSRLGIGTITPGAALQIGTLTPANITTPANSLMVSGDLEVGGSIFMGPMSFPADSGAISWIDMPVSTSVAADTVESYTASLGGTSILTIYGEALGAAGGVDATRVGIGTTTPGNLLSIQQAGTATNNTNIFSLTNSGNGASMTNTRTSILFNQYYYDAATPALVDSGNISVGTEGNWTSTTSTQDAYMAFSTVLNGTMGEKMRISSAGYLGIGIIAPTALLHLNGAAGTVGFELNSNETTNASDVLMVRSDVGTADNSIFRVTAEGNVYADGAFTPSGADYAEYFKTKDTDLAAGEAVCIDPENENAVIRCNRTGDNNIMGIVSSTPSVIGNARDGRENDPNYKVIGMIGQIIGNVSTTENGEIAVGDSLTAASIPGYMRKANAGESTVGIAMENFDGTKGQIHILISRRNQSLTVEKVEEAVEKNIAAMELQDQVDNLVSQASSNLNAQIENLSTTFSPAQKNIITAGITAATDPIIAMQNKLQSQMDLIQEQNDVIAGFIANMDVASMLYDESLNLGSGLLEADGIVAGALTVKIEDEKNKTIGSNYIEPKDEDNDGKSYIIKTKAVTETATIFTSFQANPNAYSWVEKVKDPETKEYIGFKINLNSEVSSRVYFDWWIVEKDDRTEEPKVEDSIEASTEASIEASAETVPAQTTTTTETEPGM